MSELPHVPNYWGIAQQSFHPTTFHITKENKSIYLTVVWMLGMTVFISLIGMIALSFTGRNIPQALIALSSVAVGALGSLFTHSK